MGVFCLDRAGAPVFGTSGRLWGLCLDALVVLGAPEPDAARALAARPDGFVPSWLARGWSDALFERLGDLVVVGRPARPGSPDLVPVGLYRRGAPPAWARTGEHLGIYDTPSAPVLLALAQALAVAGAVVVTTLRPPAPGTPVSDVAARVLRRRSGLLTPS